MKHDATNEKKYIQDETHNKKMQMQIKLTDGIGVIEAKIVKSKSFAIYSHLQLIYLGMSLDKKNYVVFYNNMDQPNSTITAVAEM